MSVTGVPQSTFRKRTKHPGLKRTSRRSAITITEGGPFSDHAYLSAVVLTADVVGSRPLQVAQARLQFSRRVGGEKQDGTERTGLAIDRRGSPIVIVPHLGSGERHEQGEEDSRGREAAFPKTRL
jgi:hypothetical protein